MNHPISYPVMYNQNLQFIDPSSLYALTSNDLENDGDDQDEMESTSSTPPLSSNGVDHEDSTAKSSMELSSYGDSSSYFETAPVRSPLKSRPLKSAEELKLSLLSSRNEAEMIEKIRLTQIQEIDRLHMILEDYHSRDVESQYRSSQETVISPSAMKELQIRYKQYNDQFNDQRMKENVKVQMPSSSSSSSDIHTTVKIIPVRESIRIAGTSDDGLKISTPASRASTSSESSHKGGSKHQPHESIEYNIPATSPLLLQKESRHVPMSPDRISSVQGSRSSSRSGQRNHFLATSFDGKIEILQKRISTSRESGSRSRGSTSLMRDYLDSLYHGSPGEISDFRQLAKEYPKVGQVIKLSDVSLKNSIFLSNSSVSSHSHRSHRCHHRNEDDLFSNGMINLQQHLENKNSQFQNSRFISPVSPRQYMTPVPPVSSLRPSHQSQTYPKVRPGSASSTSTNGAWKKGRKTLSISATRKQYQFKNYELIDPRQKLIEQREKMIDEILQKYSRKDIVSSDKLSIRP